MIDPSREGLDRLTEGLLAAGLYVDRDVARGALADRSQFNAIGTDGSDRQLDDVAGILAIASGLDLSYIDRWAAKLGVNDAWRALREEAS